MAHAQTLSNTYRVFQNLWACSGICTRDVNKYEKFIEQDTENRPTDMQAFKGGT